MTPVTSTDGAGGVAGRQWYVAYVALRAEKAVRDHLLRQNYEVFVASRSEVHVWRRSERRVIEQVLIPAVVFVRVDESERIRILKQPNVKSFMVNPAARKTALGKNPPAVIPEAEMQLFQAMLAQHDYEVQFATSGFAVGDQVRVLGFEGGDQPAQIIHLPDRKSPLDKKSTYVGVRVSFLGCAYMQVPTESLIKVKP